jgi:hypothetical protein
MIADVNPTVLIPYTLFKGKEARSETILLRFHPIRNEGLVEQSVFGQDSTIDRLFLE